MNRVIKIIEGRQQIIVDMTKEVEKLESALDVIRLYEDGDYYPLKDKIRTAIQTLNEFIDKNTQP